LSKATAAAIIAAQAAEKSHKHRKEHSIVSIHTTKRKKNPPSLKRQTTCCSSRYLNMTFGAGKDVDVVIGQGLIVSLTPHISGKPELFGSPNVNYHQDFQVI